MNASLIIIELLERFPLVSLDLISNVCEDLRNQRLVIGQRLSYLKPVQELVDRETWLNAAQTESKELRVVFEIFDVLAMTKTLISIHHLQVGQLSRQVRVRK